MNVWLERDQKDGVHDHENGHVTVTVESDVLVHVDGHPRVCVRFEDGGTLFQVVDPLGNVLFEIETLEEVE